MERGNNLDIYLIILISKWQIEGFFSFWKIKSFKNLKLCILGVEGLKKGRKHKFQRKEDDLLDYLFTEEQKNKVDEFLI